MPSLQQRGIRRRDVLKTLATAGIGLTAGGAAHGYMYERHHVGVTRSTLNVSGLSDALAGLRIGFLTDIHRSQTVGYELIERAVRMTLDEKPDLIVLGGDYVTWGDRRYVELAAEALAPLTAPFGVVGILGNHDDDRDMPAALAARGVTMLRDARTQLRVRGAPLDLVGIRYWTRKVADISRLLRGTSTNTILLAHTPLRLFEAAELDVPLILSGHTHGGQIVLPGLGAVAARRFPIVQGAGRRLNTSIFVSRGIGTVYVPIRFNCPPEVAILTLQPATNAA